MTFAQVNCTNCNEIIRINLENEICQCKKCETRFLVKKKNNNSQSEFDIHSKKLFSYHGNNAHVVIPSSVTTISQTAFSGKNIVSLEIPGSIKQIEEGTFKNCNRLEKIILNEGIEVIGSEAFGECSLLKRIVIPASVRRIESYAFANCENLVEIVLLGNPHISPSAFDGSEYQKRIQRKKLHWCEYCGEPFKGIFIKKCTWCGKEKNYGFYAFRKSVLEKRV